MRRQQVPNPEGVAFREGRPESEKYPGSRPEHYRRGASSVPTQVFDDIPERYRDHLVRMKERLDRAELDAADAHQAAKNVDTYWRAEIKRQQQAHEIENRELWQWIHICLCVAVAALIAGVPALLGVFGILFRGWGH